MSTDFIALFDIASDVVTAEWLIKKLAENPDFAANLIEQFRDKWIPQVWTIEDCHATKRRFLWGPGGFAIRVEPHKLELYHMMPFSMFSSDLSSREELRRACLVIADLIGSTRAIYTHELMPYEGKNLDEIEKGLIGNIGPPAASFEELKVADYFGPRAWYIDTFIDLRRSSRQ